MDTFRALSQFSSPVGPHDLYIDPDAPRFTTFMGTFCKMESNAIAADLVIASQEAGHWVGFVLPERATEDTHLHRMVLKGHMVEKPCEEGFCYHLSQLGILMIYRNQSEATIKKLQTELERQENRGFFDFIFPANRSFS